MIEDVLFCFRECWIACQFKERVGTDGETFGECREEWVGSGFGRQSSVFEDDALARCRGGERFEDLAPDGIEDDARPFIRGDLVDPGHEVFLIGDDHMIGACFQEKGSLGCGAGDGDADGALDFDHLNSSYAYAAAGCGDDDKVSFGNLAKPDERTVCSKVLHPDGCSLFVRKGWGIFRDSMKGNNRDLAINSVVVEFERSGNRADGLSKPVGIDTWSYGFDSPGGLVTVP